MHNGRNGTATPLRGSARLAPAVVLVAVLIAASALLVLVTTVAPAAAMRVEPTGATTVQPEVPVLVSTSWLAERLGDSDLVVLHVGMGRDGAPTELISGARWVDYHDFAASERDGLIIEMQPTDRIVATMQRAGVSGTSHVVAYGSPGHVPARLFVTLEALGHARVSVLDGGLETWRREGRPLESAPAPASPGDFVARPRDDVMVDATWIRDRLEDPTVALVDARPASEFTGARSPGGVRPGHIPGAYNLYWEDLLASEEEPVLKPLAEVRRRYAEAGATDDGVVVSYCYIGMRASYTYLISRHLGFETRFYDGSWNEWGSRGDLPAEQGS